MVEMKHVKNTDENYIIAVSELINLHTDALLSIVTAYVIKKKNDRLSYKPITS